VKVHSLTLSYTPGNMRCDSWASFLARTLASPCFGHEPKVKVVAFSLTTDGPISNKHLKSTTTLVEIMDCQVLALHVKFNKVKPLLVVSIDVNTTLERNDNSTICNISPSMTMFSKSVVFNVLSVHGEY
jgi:hypothetical protein